MAGHNEKFDPAECKEGTLERFEEFLTSYEYTYDSLNREPPHTLGDAEKVTWTNQDKRKVFLGRYSHRNMQIEYEQVTTRAERDAMSFDGMAQKFRTRFRLSHNTTLSNYKFRKVMQAERETFDSFVIRVRQEAQTCNFQCAHDDCTVKDVLIRDQILFGTVDDTIRRQALHDEWDLTTLITKGRSSEAATKGAQSIKKEGPEEILRTKPGKYSRKYTPRKPDSHRRHTEDTPHRKTKCKRCSSPRCEGGKNCPGLKVQCFACGMKGHFKGAEICKEKDKRRRARKLEEESSSESEGSYYLSSSETTEDDLSEADATPRKSSMKRVYNRIPTVRRVGGTRKKMARKINSRYTVDITIKETVIPAYADTGADICVMSLKNARKLGLDIHPTKMRIKPYGSNSQKCVGAYTGTIMHNTSVANADIYILKKKVETLLSGPVCEELGIIKFEGAATNRAENDTPSHEKEELIAKFPTIFSGVGTLKDYEVRFYIDNTIPPVHQPARPIPFHLREKLNRELKKMEEEDIIEEHHGPAPWVSNLVLSPKDDGGIRVTVDMRQANKAIQQTHIPIPRAEEIKSQLAGYKVFSKMDFKSAFHQLKLDEESKLLTVFHAGDRLMRYKRLTMGSSPASGELAKALKPIFQDLRGVHVIHDDLIIAGKTKEDHDKAMAEACKRIEEAKMTLNPDKCIIAKDRIPWWGMIISGNGISPDPAKVENIKHITPPKTKDELKSFFCMIQSNKEFIPNLARKTSNMRQLLKKHRTFTWSKECQSEFENIKDDFREDILLQHYDPCLPTSIHVDAHQSGISAILMQGDTEEDQKIVALASRSTTPTESRYPQLDLEALAVDFGLRRFRFFIAGAQPTTIVTDHKPLESILKNARTGSIRTERIKLRHQDLSYTVKWKKGETNVADYLSRHATPIRHIPKEQKLETSELEKTIWLLQYDPYLEAVSVERIIKATREDKVLTRLKKDIRRGYLTKNQKELAPFSKIFDQLSISDSGIILKKEKIILPTSLVKTAIKKAHQGGHPGMTSMKRRLRAHFWFPGMDTCIETAIKQCKDCTMFTTKNRKNKLHPHRLEEYNAWEKISIDLFGPMPDRRHIIVAQDMVSKFPTAKILEKTDAQGVTKALSEFYTQYGTPIVHRTDNGPPFNSEEFSEFSRQRGVKHEKSFPYHPQANPVECFMRPLGKSMKIAHHNNQDSEEALNEFLAAYRATPHSSTGIAPGDILFRHGYGRDFQKTDTPDDDLIRKALDTERESRTRRDDKINDTRREERFKVGDKIYTKNEHKRKFQPNYGPETMTITEVGNGGAMCAGQSGTIRRRHYDDIKEAPQGQHEPGSPEPPPAEPSEIETRTPHPPKTPINTNQSEQGKRRSKRETRQNPKYDEYQLY